MLRNCSQLKDNISNLLKPHKPDSEKKSNGSSSSTSLTIHTRSPAAKQLFQDPPKDNSSVQTAQPKTLPRSTSNGTSDFNFLNDGSYTRPKIIKGNHNKDYSLPSPSETSPLQPKWDPVLGFVHASERPISGYEAPFNYVSPPPQQDFTLSGAEGASSYLKNHASQSINFHGKIDEQRPVADSGKSSALESVCTPSSPSPLSYAYSTPERLHNNPFSPTVGSTPHRGLSATGFGAGSGSGSTFGTTSWSSKMAPKVLFPTSPQTNSLPVNLSIPPPSSQFRNSQAQTLETVSSLPDPSKVSEHPSNASNNFLDLSLQTSGLSLDSTQSTEKTIAVRVDQSIMPDALSTTRFCQEFEDLGILGKGSYGDVHKAQHKLNRQIYAIKVCRRKIAGERDKEHKLQEIYAMATLKRCPNIIRYYDSWIEYTNEGQLLSFRMEYCDRGSVWDAWKRDCWPVGFDNGKSTLTTAALELELIDLLGQTARALHFLHSHQIAHLDVKPANIYMCSGMAFAEGKIIYKLGDFGLARKLDDTLPPHVGRNSDEGDNRYLDENLLTHSVPMDARTTAASDIFSLGACIYELSGKQPLPSRGDEWHRIREGKLIGLNRFSEEFVDAIQGMMTSDPRQRLEAFQILQHSALKRKNQSNGICSNSNARSTTLSKFHSNLTSTSLLPPSTIMLSSGSSALGSPVLVAPQPACICDVLGIYEDEEDALCKRITQVREKRHLQILGILPVGEPLCEEFF